MIAVISESVEKPRIELSPVLWKKYDFDSDVSPRPVDIRKFYSGPMYSCYLADGKPGLSLVFERRVYMPATIIVKVKNGQAFVQHMILCLERYDDVFRSLDGRNLVMEIDPLSLPECGLLYKGKEARIESNLVRNKIKSLAYKSEAEVMLWFN